MYRADRFSEATRTDRAPVVLVAIIAASWLALGVACAVDEKDTQKDPANTTVPTTAAPAAAAGEVVDSTHSARQPVTFASAQAAFTKHRYAEATESFDVYAQDHPDNAYALYMLGLSAWKSGDLSRARSALEQSLALDSTNVKTLLNLGRVLLDDGKPEEARTRVEAAVQLDTGSAEVYRMLARVQAATGQRDSSIVSYKLALSIDPADSWSMNNLGLVFIDQGRYEDALPPLARAVELRSDAPVFQNNLGVALERTGHPAAAAEAYRAALKSDSTYKKASISLARVEGKMSDSTVVDSVDLGALAQSFNDEIQAARQMRLMAKVPEKPE
jgi:tetratricopeptide (TPR) repeat protein